MAWSNGKKRSRFGIESLEGKAMMAGDVAVSLSGGELNIEGDAFNNALDISQSANGTVVVRGLADANGVATTINGLASVTFPRAVISKAQINLQDGADNVTLRNLSVGSDLKIDSGAGDDIVRALGARTGLVVGSSTEILTGVGNDTVILTNATVTGDLLADTGEGNDRVQVNGISTVSSTFKAVTGAGNDTVSVTGLNAGKALEVETDIGNDVVSLSAVSAMDGISVNTGEGLDRITVLDSSSASDVSVTAGSGNDTITLERVNSGASVKVTAEDGSDSVTARSITAASDIVFEGGADLDTLIRTALFPGNALIVADFETVR